MNRRDFLKGLSLAITALTIPVKCLDIEASVVTPEVKATLAKEIVDGLEVIMSTQPCDADYLESTLIWWKDEQLYARHVVRWTRVTLKTGEDYPNVIKTLLDEEIKSFKEQVDLYIKHGVPHPPRIHIE